MFFMIYVSRGTFIILFYFPIQNFEKILFKMSSVVTFPIISPKCSSANLKSTEINSPVILFINELLASSKLAFAFFKAL